MGVNVFLREQRSGNITFYLDYYHNGKRYREKLTLGSHRKGSNGFKAAKDTANRLAAKKAGELAEGDYNIRVNKTKISLHDYMAEFVKNYAMKITEKLRPCYLAFWSQPRTQGSLELTRCTVSHLPTI